MEKQTIALAIQGLEIQRSQIDAAIKDLQSQLDGDRQRASAPKVMRRKRAMSAAARKAISDAQKKRWAKRRNVK
jgi:hypothetical protein